MKKSLLVALLATAFATQAHAESSVTLYGLVDAAYNYQHTKIKTINADGSHSIEKERTLGLDNGLGGGSYWGLTGSEDLGNGTSAIFGLESNFNTSNGEFEESGKIFDSHAFVGLTSESWGTLTIGRQENVADEFMPDVDPFGTDFGQAGAGSVFGDSLSSTYDNSIKYVSPEFSGFQFGAAFAYNKNTKKVNGVKTREGDSTISLGLKYSDDALFLGAAYDTSKSLEADSHRTHSWSVGGSYDFEAVKVYGAFGQQRDGMFGEIFSLATEQENDAGELESTPWNTKGYRQNSWLAGISAPVGENGTVLFSYQGLTAKNRNTEYNNEPVKSRAHIFSVGYTYDLSKRTTVYGLASYGTAKNTFYPTSEEAGYREKVKSTQVAVGLRHAF